ncbi:MAG: ABC transporter permease [Actinomycetota bacterium]
MGRYLIRRFLFLALVLVVTSGVTFVIFLKLPPGDPARRATGRQTTPQTLEAARHALGLDQPWYVQYGRFAKGLVPWPGFFLNEDVYFSYANNIPVKTEIAKRLPITATLTIGGAILWLLMGIPIGIASAVRRGTWVDRSSMLFALIGVSAPTFFLGFVLLDLFHYRLPLFPGSGIPPGTSMVEAMIQGRFWLPWIALAVTSAAFYARMVRGNMLEAMSEDYVRTARAKGLSERRVIYRHALRASLTPVITLLGLDVGLLLGGAILTEVVFGLPGLGMYALQSLTSNDFPVTMGITILAAIFILVSNLIVDVVYAVLDPRVRYQ